VGLGCTLLAGKGPFETRAAAMPPAPELDPNQSWPAGEAVNVQPNPALEAVLDEAFTNPDPENPRRTRAIVLKRRDQGEADRVVTVFTPGLGKKDSSGSRRA
jgi:hypothetical protein